MNQVKLFNKNQAMKFLNFGRKRFDTQIENGNILQYIYKGSRGLQKRYSVDNLVNIKEKDVNDKRTKMLQKG